MNRQMRRQFEKSNKGLVPPGVSAKGTPKIKILAYMDSPTVATGFGTVSRNILTLLYETGKYDITVFGINHWGDPHDLPFPIYPAGTNSDNDPYGRRKFCEFALGFDFDILFLLQDTFILDFLPELIPELKRRRVGRPFKSVVYYPIDGAPKVDWIYNISFCDKLVAYAEFGKDACEKGLDIIKQLYELPTTHPVLKKGKDAANFAVESHTVITHGVNTKDFFVLPSDVIAKFRKGYFKENADKFIFMNVNRNQQRKDIPRTVNAFRIFHDKYPNTLLYLHMAMKDFGWDLVKLTESFGLKWGTDVMAPENFGPNKGYPKELLNHIYNSVDCMVSTALGEGFGLGWIEQMMVKKPVIVPHNTAMAEFITPATGWTVKSGTSPSLLTVLTSDNEVVRPLVDVEDMIEKMAEVYHNKAKVKEVTENAYNWLQKEMLWSGKIRDQWLALFAEATKEVKEAQGRSAKECANVINAELA